MSSAIGKSGRGGKKKEEGRCRGQGVEGGREGGEKEIEGRMETNRKTDQNLAWGFYRDPRQILHKRRKKSFVPMLGQ